MECKHEWSVDFLAIKFSTSWLKNKYREHLKLVALARETARLPETMEAAERFRKEESFREEFAEVARRKAEVKKRYHKKLLQFSIEEEDIRNRRIRFFRGHDDVEEDEGGKASTYVLPCPADKCRGYVESKTWKCAICETKVCKKCHVAREVKSTRVVKGVKKTSYEAHECEEDAIETATAIMKETKPCPKCASRIFRISGCPQMFCTVCHTAFNWDTGRVEMGVIHNPHYYQLMREGGMARRAVGDIVCGGAPDWQDLMFPLNLVTRWYSQRYERRVSLNGATEQRPASYVAHIKRAEFFEIVHRRTIEAQTIIAHGRYRVRPEDMERIRLEYILGKFNQDQFKHRIFLQDRRDQKAAAHNQILETFCTASTERLRYVAEHGAELLPNEVFTGLQPPTSKLIKTLEKTFDEQVAGLTQIIEFCNRAFETTFSGMGYNKPYPHICIDRQNHHLR
jgi:hypothetical protein